VVLRNRDVEAGARATDLAGHLDFLPPFIPLAVGVGVKYPEGSPAVAFVEYRVAPDGVEFRWLVRVDFQGPLPGRGSL